MQTSQTALIKNRSMFLDTYRGFAVLLMMIFHFCWDLGSFGFITFSIYDPFWIHFRSIILTLFLTAVGWSTYLAMQKSQHLPFWKRDLKLLASAAAISIATYLAAPNQWIYFGILHFIFIASLLCRPIAHKPIISALIGAAVILTYHFSSWLHFPNAFQTINTYITLPRKTLDIMFPFPWIGVVLIGPLFGHLNAQKLVIPSHLTLSIIAFMGRHALPIYLLHQVVLFGLVAAFKMVLTFLA